MRRRTERAGGSAPVSGPPLEVARVIRAVHGLPHGTPPHTQAAALAWALGACLGADSVAVTALPLRPAAAPADEAFGASDQPVAEGRGRAADDGTALRLTDGDRMVAELTIHPAAAARRLRRWPELLTTVRLLLSDIQAQLATDDAGRQAHDSAGQLADARLRAAGEMEQQRYRLERDLHDGAQHHMVALQMALAMVEHQLEAGNPAEAAGHLDRLRQLLASTEEVLHTTATGLLSLPLTESGLAAALEARLRPLPAVTLDVDPQLATRRYPPEVEATIYLACLEAVSNAHKHAPGATITLTLRHSGSGVGFEVVDTGPGFDTGGRMPLLYLAARLESVGGTLRVRSSPGGTRVAGFVAI